MFKAVAVIVIGVALVSLGAYLANSVMTGPVPIIVAIVGGLVALAGVMMVMTNNGRPKG